MHFQSQGWCELIIYTIKIRHQHLRLDPQKKDTKKYINIFIKFLAFVVTIAAYAVITL